MSSNRLQSPEQIRHSRLCAGRRAALAVLALVGALAALSGVAGAARLPALPTVLARQIAAANRTPGAPPVLLPARMPLDARRLYASGAATGHSYDFSLGAVRNCGEATACFVAAFSAHRGQAVFGRRVTVRGASRAGFRPLSCGASCSPPMIDYLVRGVLYTIQANLGRSGHDRAELIAAAAASIAAGPRIQAPRP
ncbi:MAG TPA: hypothetical protein VFN55_08985 [Solirubrobacteraceae bacterium]|nr:hypothetical protein [Solirubrobacteraceae bacterium]